MIIKRQRSGDGDGDSSTLKRMCDPTNRRRSMGEVQESPPMATEKSWIDVDTGNAVGHWGEEGCTEEEGDVSDDEDSESEFVIGK
jgi:hypothetical protein